MARLVEILGWLEISAPGCTAVMGAAYTAEGGCCGAKVFSPLQGGTESGFFSAVIRRAMKEISAGLKISGAAVVKCCCGALLCCGAPCRKLAGGALRAIALLSSFFPSIVVVKRRRLR